MTDEASWEAAAEDRLRLKVGRYDSCSASLSFMMLTAANSPAHEAVQRIGKPCGRKMSGDPKSCCDLRREFFRARPAEVRDILTRLDASIVEWIDEPEALEWRQSQQARRQNDSPKALLAQFNA
jgi:hypothetical protein